MLRQLCLGCLLVLKAGGLLTAQTLPTPTDSIPALHGRVQTTEGTPVELANVVLLCAADSTFLQGTCSRADGSFALSPASPGHYLLQVSCVGYETLLQPTDGQGSITCTLQAVSMALDETVITARRPQYRLKQGGTLETDVRHSLLARLETAADVLARLPGMRGSAEEGFTVFGKGTPLIYIDNRQLQDVTELLRLNAADIDRVELITNPGPEYDAEVKAVIRIRTIRGRDDGWGGNVRLALTQGRRPGHAEQAGVNYQRGGLSVQASAYGYLNQERMGRDARYLISSADGEGQTRDVRDAFDRRLKGHSLGASASVDYALNPRHSVGASYQFFRTPDLRMAFDSWYATMQPDGTPEERTDKTSHNLMQNTSHQLNAYYQGDAKDWHIDLTADALIGSSLDTQQAHEMHDDGTEQEIDSRNRSRNRLFAAKLIVSHPLGQGTLKFGADHTFIRRRDRFLNPQDLLPTTDSRIDERKTAAFAQYVLNVGKVSASAGLRYEHARSRYYEQGILVPEQSRTYDDWLPTLSADFPLGKVQASLSYTAKTTRPSFMQLRSSMNYNNRYIYEGGNPLLRPETVHNVQLLLLWRWLQGSVSYTRRRNAIEFQSRDYAGDAGRFLVRLAEDRVLGADVGSALHAAVFQCDERGRAPAAEPGIGLRRVAQQLDAAGRMDALAGRLGTDPGRPRDGAHRPPVGHGCGGAPLMAGRTADAVAPGTGLVEYAARQHAAVRLAPDIRENSQTRLSAFLADGKLPLPGKGQGISREAGGGR